MREVNGAEIDYLVSAGDVAKLLLLGMQLLNDAVPSAKRMAILWNPNNVVNKLELEKAATTAQALGLLSLPVEAQVLDDVDAPPPR